MSTEGSTRDRSKPIFLGGTAGNSDWRRGFMARLIGRGVAREVFFDPIVEDWNEAARAREERAKSEADLLVFYLSDPKEPGNPVSAFSLVEAALSICNEPERTLIVFDHDGIDGHARKVLEQTELLFRQQNAKVPIFRSSREAEDWIVARFADVPGTPASPLAS
jgi:hypothetical protein